MSDRFGDLLNVINLQDLESKSGVLEIFYNLIYMFFSSIYIE